MPIKRFATLGLILLGLLLVLAQPKASNSQTVASNNIRVHRWSPNGEILALVDDNRGETVFFDSQLNFITGIPKGGAGIAWKPDSSQVALASSRYIEIFNVSSGPNYTISPHALFQIQLAGGTTGFDWHPTNPQIAAAMPGGVIAIINTITGTRDLIKELYEERGSSITKLYWNSDGSKLLSHNNGNQVTVFDVHHDQIDVLPMSTRPLDILWSLDQSQIAVTSGNEILFFNAVTYAQESSLAIPSGVILTAEWVNDTMVTTSTDDTIRVWDTNTGEITSTITLERYPQFATINPVTGQIIYLDDSGTLVTLVD